jgi:hypothetical protein
MDNRIIKIIKKTTSFFYVDVARKKGKKRKSMEKRSFKQ